MTSCKEKSSENSGLGKFKPDVSHLLPTSPLSVAILDFFSASVPKDYRTAGTAVSLAVSLGIQRTRLGMSET